MKAIKFLTLISLFSSLSLACIDKRKIVFVSRKGTSIAILDKNKKMILLSKGAKLTYIGNCKVDNPEVNLLERQFKIYDYTDQGGRICFAAQKANESARFQITDDIINGPSKKGTNCGSKIMSEE